MGIAWFGGFGPGALATVLAAIASNYFFTDPFYKFHFDDPAERWRSVLFMGEGLFISILCDKLMRARRRAEASEQAARILERRILEVTEAEQGRIGRDLHDGLGQHLTGVAFLSRLLTRHLVAKQIPEADEATKIEQLVNKAVTWTRTLAAGLSPVEIDSGGLPSALRQLGLSTESIFPTRCAVRCPERLPPLPAWVPTHLYRIAQEAVNNAVKHANASHLWIELTPRAGERQLVLTVRDDGVGLPQQPGRTGGMGLQTMDYRARIIGGTVDVRRGEAGGTVVTCTCPTAASSGAAAIQPAALGESLGGAVRSTERKSSPSRSDVAPPNEVAQP
jgi:signal transduction histidine kinase